MTRNPNAKTLLQAWIDATPAGLRLAEIESRFQAIEGPPSRRTIQRWLDELLEHGRISSSGYTSSRRYFPPLTTTAAQQFAVSEPPTPASDGLITLSREASQLREQVRRPLQQRQPVGYRRALLDAYLPNQHGYLSPELVQHLHRIGRTPAGERPAGTYARDIYQRLLVDLSWASSRLEGNTYTRLDTEQLIRYGQAAQGHDAQETQMILNHKAAIELLIEDAEDIGFNVFTLLNLHAILSDNLLSDVTASGRLRQRQVQISGTVFHPLAVPQQIEDLFRLLLAKADAITDPFEQAFFVMVHLPYLQPFDDVNKRVSRLAANIPLIRHNLCPLSFLDVPETYYVDGLLAVYEQGRVELLREVFVWAYERSCQQYLATRQTLAQPDPFRLRYRNALIDVVHRLVGHAAPVSRDRISELASGQVDSADLAAFIAMVETDLAHLHEGNIARYRLRPSQLRAWLIAQPGSRSL